MCDSIEPPLQDVALVGRRWSSGITLSTGELSTLLLLSESETMSGPCFKMDDQERLVEANGRLKGPAGDVIKDCCSGSSLTAILNCILMLLILVALIIISIQGQQLATQGTLNNQGDASLNSNKLACPTPYTMVMGECFYVQNVYSFTFSEAQAYCKAMGGDLAEPKTAQTLLSYQVDTLGPLKQRQSYWIGGSDPDGDGQFNWLSGRPVDKSEWQQGMPSETHWNKRCLRYYLASSQPGVADGKCDEAQNTICEYPINQ